MENTITLLQINWVDLLSLILLLRMSYVGFARGLSNEMIPLIATYIALVVAIHFYDKVGGLLSFYTPLSGQLSRLIIFILISVIILLIFRLFTDIVVGRVVSVQVATVYDSVCGVVVGAIRGVLVVCIVVSALELTSVKYLRDSVKSKSFSGKKFLEIRSKVYDTTVRILRGKKR